MAQAISKLLAGVLAVGILATAGWVVVKGVEKDPAVVGTAITAAAGVGVIVWQRNREKQNELEISHREQMLPIYEQLVETLKDLSAFSEKSEDERRAFFQDLGTSLILHGPAPVINSWNTWSRAPTDPVTPGTFIAWENLLRAMRVDLGLDSDKIPRGDLLRLWINEDPDEDSQQLWAGIRSGRS